MRNRDLLAAPTRSTSALFSLVTGRPRACVEGITVGTCTCTSGYRRQPASPPRLTSSPRWAPRGVRRARLPPPRRVQHLAGRAHRALRRGLPRMDAGRGRPDELRPRASAPSRYGGPRREPRRRSHGMTARTPTSGREQSLVHYGRRMPARWSPARLPSSALLIGAPGALAAMRATAAAGSCASTPASPAAQDAEPDHQNARRNQTKIVWNVTGVPRPGRIDGSSARRAWPAPRARRGTPAKGDTGGRHTGAARCHPGATGRLEHRRPARLARPALPAQVGGSIGPWAIGPVGLGSPDPACPRSDRFHWPRRTPPRGGTMLAAVR
jgi:hypothetical protein